VLWFQIWSDSELFHLVGTKLIWFGVVRYYRRIFPEGKTVKSRTDSGNMSFLILQHCRQAKDYDSLKRCLKALKRSFYLHEFLVELLNSLLRGIQALQVAVQPSPQALPRLFKFKMYGISLPTSIKRLQDQDPGFGTF
jgi:hypothetical protein